MRNQVFWELPEGYRLHLDVKLADDRKTLKLLAVLQLAVIAVLVVCGRLHCPFVAAFDMEGYQTAIGFGTMAVGILVYIIAHEWVHGIAIRFITGRTADFGINLKKGMAYASSPAYFGKLPYIIIALAPVVVWGIILGLLLQEVPAGWFWYLYAIQIMNVSGAVGDFYVTWLTLRAPKAAIVKDSGTSMLFYVPEDSEKTAEEIF